MYKPFIINIVESVEGVEAFFTSCEQEVSWLGHIKKAQRPHDATPSTTLKPFTQSMSSSVVSLPSTSTSRLILYVSRIMR